MPSQEFKDLYEQLMELKPTISRTLEEQRASMDMVADQLPCDPAVVITPVDANGVSCEWLDWPDMVSDQVLIFIHGGGYVIGSAKTHRDLASRISKEAGCRVLNVDYRLAPENPYPAALDDVTNAYLWLMDQRTKASDICVVGDSAGGGLTFSLLLNLKKRGIALPAAAVGISPLTDNSRSGSTFEKLAAIDPIVTPEVSRQNSASYVGPDGDAIDPLVSPLFGELEGLPPIQLLTGTADILHDDALRFEKKAKEAGVDVELRIEEDMIHIWPYFAQVIPEGRQAVCEIAGFIRTHLN